jgi:Calcineurin-like phosphoesterase
MISDYLDREYVLSETRAQRDWLMALQKKVLKKDKSALAELRKNKVTLAQITRAIAALDAALSNAKKDREHPQGTPFIPKDPITCGLQAGLTRIAIESGDVTANTPPPPAKTALRRAAGKARVATAADTSPTLRLRRRARPAAKGKRAGVTRAPFIEGEDARYALDGFKAKFGALFSKHRAFNSNPARVARSAKPLSLFLFGDWGTGLNLAAQVTQRIREQLNTSDGSRQCHVIHLGDVYYVGESDEYLKRMIPFWPVTSAQRNVIGSWSVNGNHDMYSGGEGYFDTLLRKDYMLRWHGDQFGEPSSFFLIEDKDWQVFGLDTSWKIPSLGDAIFGKPTLKDYGGQNGVLTKEQVTWMSRVRNPAKGCILLTHHQPASSRTSESQHADEAVAMMKAAGVHSQIDAWIWGHEHRCVVFKPKAQRKNQRLKEAPAFCACLGHGGVPVTKKNMELDKRIPDVLWEEDRLDADAPIYEGQRVVPFGFGRIDTKPGAFEFQAFDHNGKARFGCVVARATGAGVPSAPSRTRRNVPKAKPKTKPKASK